jgi:RimJ/RimL family protein N-acetyltransferase
MKENMIEVSIQNRSSLAPLFQYHKRQRVVIDAILEQPYGQALADQVPSPQIARLHLGAFTLFAGNPNHPLAKQFITTSPSKVLIAETDDWKSRILNLLGKNCSTYLRTGFSFDKLNIDHIQQLAQNIPQSYHIHPLNQKLAQSEYTGTAYANAETLLQNGTGFFALQNDQIASVAVAYTNSNQGIEVQIYTYDNHKQKGLATCTSAALIAHCLERNIDPHWSAANTISAKLAQKLGYVQNDQYDAIVYKPIHKEGSPS